MTSIDQLASHVARSRQTIYLWIKKDKLPKPDTSTIENGRAVLAWKNDQRILSLAEVLIHSSPAPRQIS